MKFKHFYKKTIHERQRILSNMTSIDLEQFNTSLPLSVANNMIENCITIYGMPLGIASNFIIDNKVYHAPMATEEPSVIAAASYGASIIQKNGGFTVEQNDRGMIGEIAFDITHDPQLFEKWQQIIQTHKTFLLTHANNAYPSLVKRGGGAYDLWCERKVSSDNCFYFFIIYLAVDTQEAMGANMLNTMLESLKIPIQQLLHCNAIMSTLSNYAIHSLVSVSCRILPQYLSHSNTTLNGLEVAKKIVQAYQLASADIFRATTHNKGVMNGISSVVLASGNDTRAIEAGIHAYACYNGAYQPITQWTLEDDQLVGSITVPLPIGYVGGSIAIHPSAKLAQKLSLTTNAKQLAALMASVGLAQNLSALRALVSEGIQHGHMSLQLKSLAISIGANENEIDRLVDRLKHLTPVNQQIATEQLQQLRKQAHV